MNGVLRDERTPMPLRTDLLRLAVATAHAVPGAELRLATIDGAVLVVAHHPAADLDPCAMRRVVLAGACAAAPDPSRQILAAELGGVLVDEGGGVWREDGRRGLRWWVATLLSPRHVARLLDETAHLVPGPDEVAARILPDRELGITLVEFSAATATASPTTVRLAAHEAIGPLVVAELVCATRTRPATDPDRRHAARGAEELD